MNWNETHVVETEDRIFAGTVIDLNIIVYTISKEDNVNTYWEN